MVEANHRNRGYYESKIINPATGSGYHVAYHYFIGRDGTLVQTRTHDDRSAHTSCGLGFEKCKNLPEINERSLGIVLAGDFEHEVPDRRQIVTLRNLVKKLQKEYNIPTDHILGHTDASPTSCPGENLLKLLPTHYHPEQ